MNWNRVGGLLLRYWFLYSRTVFRVMDLTFWPLMDLLVWGFLTMYMVRMQNMVPSYVIFLIGAIIFWNVLYRAQQSVTVSFLEDIWSHNLLNVFVAPVRISEFIAATYIVGLIQSLIVMILMSIMAFAFYSYNITNLGFALMPLFLNLLIMGWWMGMATVAMIVRWGHSAEALAWAVPYLVQPISAVFYPVTVLPVWLQPLAYAMPSTHVFEGMRQLLKGQPLNENTLLYAFGLNAIYMVLSALLFNRMFAVARKRGLLAKIAF